MRHLTQFGTYQIIVFRVNPEYAALYESSGNSTLFLEKVLRNADGSFKTEIISAIKIEGDITEEQRSMLIEEANNCYITQLVKGEWDIKDSLELKSEAEE